MKIGNPENGKYNNNPSKNHIQVARFLREGLPEEEGLFLLAEGYQRWGHLSLLWELVPKSGSSHREGLLLCPHLIQLWGEAAGKTSLRDRISQASS